MIAARTAFCGPYGEWRAMMKLRFLRGALCASLLALGLAAVPTTSASAAPVAPGIPQSVTAVAGGHQITIRWSPPAAGPTPTGYQVYALRGTTNCSLVATTVCVVDLDPNLPAGSTGTLYSYKVRAFNGAVAGPYSANASTLYGVPSAPLNVSGVPGSASALVSWSPSITTDKPLQGYVVTASDGHTCSTMTTSCSVPFLINGHAYTFSVKAKNSIGYSPASALSNVVTSGAPRAPSGLVAVAGPRSADISFTTPVDNGSPINSYVVTATDVTNPSDPSNGSQWSGSGSPIHKPSLTPGHSYTFTLNASNAFGQSPESAPSNQITEANVPGAPTNLVAVGGARSADVSFTAPADNGAAITFYVVTATDVTNPSDPSNGSQWGNTESPVHKPSLTAGHSYTFTISASNSIGQGPESAPSNEIALANVPDAPTDLVAVAGIGSADVSFTTPADNGSPIGYYVITATDVSNPSDPSNGTQWAGGNPVHKPGLTAGDSYTFTVSAANGIGNGPESAASNQVTVL
jgi:hypothetical protein